MLPAPAGTTFGFAHPGVSMRRILSAVGAALVAAACSSEKPVAKVDDSGLARLNESQMEPVDEARIEEGRAHDALAHARANEADARARFEVARSERGVAEAQLKRALAEHDARSRGPARCRCRLRRASRRRTDQRSHRATAAAARPSSPSGS